MGPYDVIIIGAGPAGLICAAHCGRESLRTLVLEKNAKAGRKLLLTGAGRCNLTHDGPIEDLLDRYGDKARFVKPALLAFTNDDMVTFIEGMGLWMVVEAGDKVFPAKGDARDVLRALLDACRTKGVSVRYGEPVKEVGPGLDVRTGKDTYRARTVVIATGGRSYPGTGSTGDGYALVKTLGHTIVGPAPALAPVIVRGYRFSGCAGISLGDVGITVFREGKKVHGSRGDVLLTHKGLSGPGILDLSRYVRTGDMVRVALVDRDVQAFERELVDELAAQGKRSLLKCAGGAEHPPGAQGVPARQADPAAAGGAAHRAVLRSGADRRVRRGHGHPGRGIRSRDRSDHYGLEEGPRPVPRRRSGGRGR